MSRTENWLLQQHNEGLGKFFSTELLNRHQLTNIIQNNSDGVAELLSVIILQLDFPNLQNLFTLQYFGKASTSRTI